MVPATEDEAGPGYEIPPGVDPMSVQVMSEITLYKMMPCMPFYSDQEKTTFSNPLIWWKELSHRFPLLSRRAQKVLAAMGTSAPSERVFSSRGNVVTKNRASMHADTVANLILLKQSLREPAKAFGLKKVQKAVNLARKI